MIYAKGDFLNQIVLIVIEEVTLKKDLSSVIFVRRRLLSQMILRIIEELTNDKNFRIELFKVKLYYLVFLFILNIFINKNIENLN